MRSLSRAILAGSLGLAVSLIVAACGGGSGLLSGDQSSTINDQLGQISSALRAGDCTTVSKVTVSLARSVAQLPPTINPTLRQNLDQGVSTVGQLANQQCKPAASTSTTTTSTSSTASTTATTPSTTTTPTATATSTPTTTTSTSTAPPATTPASPGTTSTGSGGAGIGGGSGKSNSGPGTSHSGGGASVGPAGAVAPGPPGGTSADTGHGKPR